MSEKEERWKINERRDNCKERMKTNEGKKWIKVVWVKNKMT